MGFENISFTKGTTVLITGGAGFIGSNIAEALLDKGCRVRVLDNFSTGRRENIAGFLKNPNFELVEGDIRDYDSCVAACEGARYVSHQAAWGSVPRSIEHPLLYDDINIKGTLNMMEAARHAGVERFIYASSSSVYGDEPNLPKVENRVGRLLSPYALTKRTDEEYGCLYNSLYGLKTIGMRYFNVFGRRQDPQGAYAAVIPRFITLLMNGETPVINGDGLQSRDFTYIDNVIEANMRAMQAGESACGRAYNIAYGGRVFLNDLYDEIVSALEKRMPLKKTKPIYGPDRAGDIKHSNADISLAKQYLGYDPEFSFEKGIELAIDWYIENL